MAGQTRRIACGRLFFPRGIDGISINESSWSPRGAHFMSKAMQLERKMWSKHYTYDEWMEAQGIPIHRGYYIEDLRTLELAWWGERQCNSAFIQLVGQEGVTSARVTEIAAGKTLPPLKFALDEIVYVVEGRGLTTIWSGKRRPRKSFA